VKVCVKILSGCAVNGKQLDRITFLPHPVYEVVSYQLWSSDSATS